MRNTILVTLGVLFLVAATLVGTAKGSDDEEVKCSDLAGIHKELYKEFREEPKNVGSLDESEDRIEILVNEDSGTFTVLLLRELPDGNVIGCYLFSGTHWKNIVTLRDKHRSL